MASRVQTEQMQKDNDFLALSDSLHVGIIGQELVKFIKYPFIDQTGVCLPREVHLLVGVRFSEDVIFVPALHKQRQDVWAAPGVRKPASIEHGIKVYGILLPSLGNCTRVFIESGYKGHVTRTGLCGHSGV